MNYILSRNFPQKLTKTVIGFSPMFFSLIYNEKLLPWGKLE